MTSVVAVEVAPDLKSCKAYISVLGDEEAAKAAVDKVSDLYAGASVSGSLTSGAPLAFFFTKRNALSSLS